MTSDSSVWPTSNDEDDADDDDDAFADEAGCGDCSASSLWFVDRPSLSCAET